MGQKERKERKNDNPYSPGSTSNQDSFTLREGFEPSRNKSSTGSPGLRPTGLGDLSLGGYWF